ncbi:putative transcription factor MADS-MIKC family [Dioscorea sansibarensis]
MGRGRVELKRIENKINRQVTFAKRKNGLLKKAHELAVLCEVELALIIFSTRGKLFEFSSTSMFKILDKYRTYHNAASDATVPDKDNQDDYQEYLNLKAGIECLQRSQRNLLGADLGSLNAKELGQLEDQVEMSLHQIRSKKTQLMLDNLCDLKRKEQILQDANTALERKLIEANAGNPFHSEALLQPSLQIGYNPIYLQQSNTQITSQTSGFMPMDG